MDSNSKQNILAGLVGTSPIVSRLDANGGANSAVSSSSLGGGGGSATPGATGRQHKLKQRFTVIRKLGKGTYGKVQLAINKSTGQEVAIKTIKKSKIESPQDLERVRREIQIMSSIEHPHIIHIYEVFENKDKIVLVMQYAPGGELYEYVSEQKVLEEAEARRLFRQIATAIYYCHKNKICHRDLKLENILLDEKNNAKIADFGLSNVFDKRRQLKTFCGSPLYASPEIVQGSPYEGPEVDCWSLGVLLYTLVYGAMPFDGSNFKRLVKQITESTYCEPKQKSQASPLIGKLLCADPNKRATIVDVCSDPWVNGLSQSALPSSPTSTLPSTSLLQVAQDMANLTPVRFDILLALAPPSSPPPPPSMASAERPPLACQSSLLNVGQKKPAIMEMDEPNDGVVADSHSPVASYIVRDLTEKMEYDKENERVSSHEASPSDVADKQVIEEEEPMEVEQAKEEGEEAKKVDVAPTASAEEEKSEAQVEEEVAIMDVELAQSPQRPQEDLAQTEVEDTLDNKTLVKAVGPAEEPTQLADQQKDDTEQKPAKKVKKKIVVVKKKKKVSTKKDGADGEAVAASVAPSDESKGDKSKTDKSTDERTSTSIKRTQQQVGGERVGKVKIPETFSGQQGDGESPPVPSKGSLETRRQSALVADVAQKLLLAAQGGSPSANSELKDDLASLASVRVSETKDEFERRASLAATLIASQAKEAIQGRDSPEILHQASAKTLRELLEILDQSAILEPVRAASPKEAEMLVAKAKIENTLADNEKTSDERSDSVETIKAQEQLESSQKPNYEAPLKMAPITRSYKKVTFTKDGACITETGRIYSTRGEDGTVRRVERKSKVTHFPSSTPDGRREEVSQEEEEEEVTSYGGEVLHQWPTQPGKQEASISGKPFEKLIMPSSSLFGEGDEDDDDEFVRTASGMGRRRPSSTRGEFKRADSRSSCSSGSTDAFDDIFDTWTGAISMFSNTNWPTSSNFNGHNNFRPLSSLFGTTGRRRHRHSTSNSPRCASADVGAGPSWQSRDQQQQQPSRPRSGWSPHSSGYDSDAPLDRPASAACGPSAGPSSRLGRPRSSLFGSSQQLQSLFQQPSSSSLGAAAMLQTQPGDLARSLAAEHEQLRRRLDRQHRQLWKGSTPSLFDDRLDDNATNEDLALFSPDLFGSSLMGQRDKSPGVAGRPPRPGPSASSSSGQQQQNLVEQSQSSSSFTSRQLRHSLALDSTPRRFHQQQQQQLTQVERSSSMVRSQLANLQLTSSATGDSLPNNSSVGITKPATFIQLKRTSSIKHMDTQQLHENQSKSKSNTGSIRSTAFFELGSAPKTSPEVARSHQVEDKRAAEERVQHWLQDNTSSAGSQSSASKTTSSASLQSAATSQNTTSTNTNNMTAAAAVSQFNKHSVTSFATSSSSSRRRVESQLEQQGDQHQFAKTMSKHEVFSVREEFQVQGDEMQMMTPTSSKLEWISQSQNDLLNSMATIEKSQQQEESGSLLEQLRSRGYRSLINRRLVAGEQQVSSSSSSLINSEPSAQTRLQQVQVQKQHHVSTTSTSSENGAQHSIQHHFSSSLAAQLGVPDEDQHEDFQPEQEPKVANETAQVSAPTTSDDKAEPEVDEEEDEDVREAKRNIKAYVERMRETELFLKSLQQVEEEQARRQREQSFLLDNLMFSASRFVGTGTGAKQPPSYINLPADVGGERTNAIEWMPAQFATVRGSCSAPVRPATIGNDYIKPLPTSQAYLSSGSPPTTNYLGGSPYRAFGCSKTLSAVDPLEPVQPLFGNHFDGSPMVQRQHFRRSKSQLSDQFTTAHRSPSLFNHSPPDPMQNLDNPILPSSRRPLSMRLTLPATPQGPAAAARSRRSLSQVRWPMAWSNPSSASTSEYRSAYCNPHDVESQKPQTNGSAIETGSGEEEDEEEEDEMSEYRASAYVPKVVPQGQPPPLRQTRVGRSHQRGPRAASPYLEVDRGETTKPRRRNSMQQLANYNNLDDTPRRLSTSNAREESSSSRLTELEQRIQENKRRRQQLLSGELSASSSAKNRDNRENASENEQAAESPADAASNRQTIRLAARPSRLESMEARIKRRSYCVQVAGECSPERRPTARRGSFLL